MPLVKRWAQTKPFNPSGSSPNTMSYLKLMGYPIGKDKTTGKPSTGEDSLERILRSSALGDPVIPRILSARRLRKASSYLQDAHVGLDERIHTTFTLDPGTGRLASKNPNLMNLPQGKADALERELAKAIRSCVQAPPGWVLIERDWKAIEALLTGYFAKDDLYMRYARLGVHAILAARHLKQPLNLELPDQELALLLRDIKKTHKMVYDNSKATVHAFNYGRTVWGIAKDLEKLWIDTLKLGDDLPSAPPNFRKEAQSYVNNYESLAPKILDWQGATREEAHNKGILYNPFGYCLRFFDVFRTKEGSRKLQRDRKGRLLGEQANEPLSFRPQSTGAGMLRETILEFGKKKTDLQLILPIHDSLLFLAPEKDKDEYLEYTRDVMERPFPQLEGLRCMTEATSGVRWSEMEEL